MVRYQNMASDWKELKLAFDLSNRKVTLTTSKDERKIELDFENNHLELAWYAMIARHSQLECKFKFFRQNRGYEYLQACLFMDEIYRINDKKSIDIDFNGHLGRDGFLKICEQWDDDLGLKYGETIESFKVGFVPSHISTNNNKLQTKLQKTFPQHLVDCLLPAFVFQKYKENEEGDKKIRTIKIEGNNYCRGNFSPSQPRNSAYGLWLKEENIIFINEK